MYVYASTNELSPTTVNELNVLGILLLCAGPIHWEKSPFSTILVWIHIRLWFLRAFCEDERNAEPVMQHCALSPWEGKPAKYKETNGLPTTRPLSNIYL